MKTLKHILVTLTIGSALLLSSCDKAKDKVKVDVSFDLNLPSAKMYIDTISQFGNVNLATTTFQSNLQKTLDDNNANMDDIESISLRSAELTMLNPGAQNFNIITKLYGYMSATGLAETRVAYLDPVPSNVTQITLNSDNADLVEYLKKSEVNFRVSGVTTGPNVERDTLNVKLIFSIKAKVTPLQ